MKILVVEDDRVLNKSIVKLLKTQQYSVDMAFDGEEALDYIMMAQYDVLLIDVMMPKMNGFDLVKELRQRGVKTPVLLLTARDSLEDKIQGLDLGADDYVVKPFEFDELLARIRALLRRDNRQHLTSTIKLGELVVDLNNKQLFKQGVMLDLTAKEYQIFEYLVRNSDRVLSREQIREHVWGFDYLGESNIIDVLVKNLRKKIGDSTLIETRRGVGYLVKSEKITST
ncbi:response regulator transcription factor [Streptococcus fryi]